MFCFAGAFRAASFCIALRSQIPQGTIDKMRCTNIRAHNVDFLSLDPQQAPWSSCDAVTLPRAACSCNFDSMYRYLLTPVAAAVACVTNTVQLSRKAMFTSLLICNPKYSSMRSHFPMLFGSSTGSPFPRELHNQPISTVFAHALATARSTCSHYEAENEGVVNAVRFLCFIHATS